MVNSVQRTENTFLLNSVISVFKLQSDKFILVTSFEVTASLLVESSYIFHL